MSCQATTSALKKFRSEMLKKANIGNVGNHAATIDKIYYEIDDDNFTYLRHYEYRIRNLETQVNSEPMKYTEDLTNMFTW